MIDINDDEEEETVFKILNTCSKVEPSSVEDVAVNTFESKRISYFDPYENNSKPEDYLRISLSFKDNEMEPNSFRE
jgi:hypothetical protein